MAGSAQRQRSEPRTPTGGDGGKRDVVDGFRLGRAVRRAAAASAAVVGAFTREALAIAATVGINPGGCRLEARITPG